MLNYLKIEYDEVIYKSDEDWEENKEFLPSLFPKLPYLQDGKYFQAETVAILEYLAAKFYPRMAGINPEEKGLLSEVRAFFLEASNATRQLFYTSGDKDEIM